MPEPSRLSWFPVRFITPLARREVALREVLERAPRFGLSRIEIHHSLVADDAGAAAVAELVEELGLSVSMLSCAPDFAHPDETVRARELREMRRLVRVARDLGCDTIRATAGKEDPGLDRDRALAVAARCLRDLAEYALPLGVTPCLENHLRDRSWEPHALDLARDRETFLTLLDALGPEELAVNFDTGQPMVAGLDELELLEQVLPRVCNVHAGDRRRGQRQHEVIGAGDVRFDAIFARLASVGYDGPVSVEDASEAGDEGLRQAVAFLRRALAEAEAQVADAR